MREYELIYIVHPDLDESAFNEVVERVNGWITEGGGEILNIDLWGKKKLAYPIRKQEEGQYVFMLIKTDPSFGVEIERNLRLQEPVMRFSLISAN
jgi:small subunit ribosomal protein S6